MRAEDILRDVERIDQVLKESGADSDVLDVTAAIPRRNGMITVCSEEDPLKSITERDTHKGQDKVK